MASAPVEPEHAGDHARGAPAPAVIIIQYGDYDCPHTRASEAVVRRLLEENPDVRLVFRHFPLRHLHANAEMLARIAEAADRLGKFWPMHEHVMAHRAAIGSRAVLESARASGIDIDRVAQLLDDPAIAARVQRDVEHGKESGVHSTPTFFFDGALHDGRYDYDTLAARLLQARKAGKSPA